MVGSSEAISSWEGGLLSSRAAPDSLGLSGAAESLGRTTTGALSAASTGERGVGRSRAVIRTCRCLSDQTDHVVFHTELAALFVVDLICLLLLALLKMYPLTDFLKNTLRNSHNRMTSYYKTLLGVLTRTPKFNDK